MTSPNNEPENPYTSTGKGTSDPNTQPYQPPIYQGQNQQQYGGQQYQNQQYPGPQQGGPQYGYGYPMPHPMGAQLAQTSMILGILSLFVVGIILGPIAISKANKAEREFNTASTVGKVTGWIGTILGILYLPFLFFVLVGAFMAPMSSF